MEWVHVSDWQALPSFLDSPCQNRSTEQTTNFKHHASVIYPVRCSPLLLRQGYRFILGSWGIIRLFPRKTTDWGSLGNAPENKNCKFTPTHFGPFSIKLISTAKRSSLCNVPFRTVINFHIPLFGLHYFLCSLKKKQYKHSLSRHKKLNSFSHSLDWR